MYLLNGVNGDPIHAGDSVYFDRMWYGSWNPTYSLAATTSGLAGVTSMASRSVFVIDLPPQPSQQPTTYPTPQPTNTPEVMALGATGAICFTGDSLLTLQDGSNIKFNDLQVSESIRVDSIRVESSRVESSYEDE
jgi:hypothetical protein